MEEFVRPAIKELKEYTPGKNPQKAGMIKLASNENPFGPSPKALEAIAKEAKSLQIYPDQKSILLKDALARKLKLSDENIIIGNGSDEIMQLLAATYLKPGEEVIISQNTFSVYEFVTRLFDGQPVFVPLKDFAQDIGAIEKAVTPQTKMIFLCNPHNPTGSIVTAAELESLLAKIPDHVLVVVDEAYMEFVEDKSFPDSIKYVKDNKNVLVLQTFSKYYGLAGLRVGYGLAKKELIKYLMRSKLPFNVNRLAQAAAKAALDDKKFLEMTYKNNQAGKKYLYAELDKLGLEYKKTESNFILINLKKSADDLFLKLMKKGVIVRPLSSFGLPEAIRVSIGTPDQNEKLIRAFT
ncbi:MAG: histidinol-phosphate transaminase [bacterium]